MKLPPVFHKVRLRLPKDDVPPVVINCRGCSFPSMEEVAKSFSGDDRVPLELFERVWFEFDDAALYARAVEDQVEEGNVTTFILSVFDTKGKKWDGFRVNLMQPSLSLAGLDGDLLQARKLIIAEFIAVSHHLWKISNEPAPASINTLTRNQPAAFIRIGDTLRYEKASSLRSRAGQEAQRCYDPPSDPSGIKKRDHAVRGHWRTYKSGVKVWVKSHRRGDPELGTVTRVLTL